MGIRNIAASGAGGPDVSGVSSVSGSTSAVTVLAANTARKAATFYNDSTSILYLLLNNGTPSTTNFTAKVQADDYYEVPITQGGVYRGIIKGIWASATGAARVTEFT